MTGRRRDDDSGWLAGRKPVREALRRDGGQGAVELVLLSSTLPGALIAEFERLGADAGVPVRRRPREALDRAAGGAVHQGVMARIGRILPVTLVELLERARPPALLLLLDRVTDPRNLGAAVRSAAAAGADGVILPRRRSAPASAAAWKASAGTLGRIPLASCSGSAAALLDLGRAGIQRVGLEAGAPAPWTALDLRGPTCLVVGAEGEGLSRLVRERCDALTGFPLAGGVESLNVAVAASLALYEAIRQRACA